MSALIIILLSAQVSLLSALGFKTNKAVRDLIAQQADLEDDCDQLIDLVNAMIQSDAVVQEMRSYAKSIARADEVRS